MTCAEAELVTEGICGAEGNVWLAISGSEEQIEMAEKLLKAVDGKPGLEL